MKRTMMKTKGTGAVLQKDLAIVFLGLLLSLCLLSCKGNSQAKESEGTKAEESTTAKSEEKDMVSTAAAEESTEGAHIPGMQCGRVPPTSICLSPILRMEKN